MLIEIPSLNVAIDPQDVLWVRTPLQKAPQGSHSEATGAVMLASRKNPLTIVDTHGQTGKLLKELKNANLSFVEVISDGISVVATQVARLENGMVHFKNDVTGEKSVRFAQKLPDITKALNDATKLAQFRS